MALIDN